MAGKSTFLDNAFLALLYNATAFANVAINATSSPITNIYVALHTADPTAAGNQSSSEVSYGSYARVAVARTSSGWVVTGAVVNPAANINFPTGTTGSGSATYFSTGSGASGATPIFHVGTLNPVIPIGTGITPTLTTASSIQET